MKIKICGLKREEDITIINRYNVDYIGFVFAPSKRQITKDTAKHLKAMLRKDIQVVGVFVDEKIDNIIDLIEEQIIDIIQLHGHEDHQYIQQLKFLNKPIIKAIPVISKASLDVSYDADYYLLDNKTAGSGQTFNWDDIRKLDKPIFLAGGINASNMKEACKKDVYALDLSSGVEVNGFKNEEKIKEIMEIYENER